jgi:hypothetical protein
MIEETENLGKRGKTLPCDTRRVNLVTNPVISHERGKDLEVFTTCGIYHWSFVTQIFHNSQASHGGDRKLSQVVTRLRGLFVILIETCKAFKLRIKVGNVHWSIEYYISMEWFQH